MAFLTGLLSVSEPTGVWETIIKAFESGVGSYILAIVLITLIIKVIWAPIETINKKINKKNMRIQAKIQPELEKIKTKYGADKNLVNQKTQELYKKNNYSMMGSCLFMLVFLALNLTIFFTLFAGINSMADYKISQQYDYLKYNYANVLNLTDEVYERNHDEVAENDIAGYFENYSTLTFEVSEGYIIAKTEDGEEIARTAYKTDFSYETDENQVDADGNVIIDETTGEPLKVVVSSDQAIYELVTKYVSPIAQTGENGEQVTDPEGNVVYEERYVGDEEVAGVTYKQAIDTYATNYIEICYNNSPESSKFLWIENYWIADSHFKNSIFTYDEFVGEIGSNNVSEYEQTIYNSFMTNLSERVGRVNGYLILAILSIGISFLAVWLGNMVNRKKGMPAPKQPGGKVMMIVLPLIMGIFAIFYNSVFAIYMVVSQAISAALAPLENLIVNKWEAHQEKKEEEKKKSVVEYRRK